MLPWSSICNAANKYRQNSKYVCESSAVWEVPECDIQGSDLIDPTSTTDGRYTEQKKMCQIN